MGVLSLVETTRASGALSFAQMTKQQNRWNTWYQKAATWRYKRATMFSVVTCFEMHIYPVRQFMAYTIRKSRGLDVDAEASDNLWHGISYTRWLDVTSTSFCVAMAILIACKLTKIKSLTDLIGAFACGYISFVVPPLTLMKVRHQQGGIFARPLEALLSLSMLGLGFFFVIYGTYTAIVGFAW